jgi:hypothetical protein
MIRCRTIRFFFWVGVSQLSHSRLKLLVRPKKIWGAVVITACPLDVCVVLKLTLKIVLRTKWTQKSTMFPRNSVKKMGLFIGFKKRFKSRTVSGITYKMPDISFNEKHRCWVSFTSTAARWTSGRREKWRTPVERNRAWLRLGSGGGTCGGS